MNNRIEGLIKEVIGINGNRIVEDAVVNKILKNCGFAIIGKNDPRRHKLFYSLGYRNWLHPEGFILERKKVVEFFPSLIVQDSRMKVLYRISGLGLATGFKHGPDARAILDEVKSEIFLHIKKENGGGTITLEYDSVLQ